MVGIDGGFIRSHEADKGKVQGTLGFWGLDMADYFTNAQDFEPVRVVSMADYALEETESPLWRSMLFREKMDRFPHGNEMLTDIDMTGNGLIDLRALQYKKTDVDGNVTVEYGFIIEADKGTIRTTNNNAPVKTIGAVKDSEEGTYAKPGTTEEAYYGLTPAETSVLGDVRLGFLKGNLLSEALPNVSMKAEQKNVGNGDFIQAPACPIGWAPAIDVIPVSYGAGEAVTASISGASPTITCRVPEPTNPPTGPATCTCPAGYTLSSGQCQQTTTVPSSSTCTGGYYCPSGGSLSGDYCSTSGTSTYAATCTCPVGYTRSDTSCSKTTTYEATCRAAAGPLTYNVTTIQVAWDIIGAETGPGDWCSPIPTIVAPYSCKMYDGSIPGRYRSGCTRNTNLDSACVQDYADYPYGFSCTSNKIYTCYYCDCLSGGYFNKQGLPKICSLTKSATATCSCPSGGTLSGTTCTGTSGTGGYSASCYGYAYSCPSGYTLSGSTCSKTTTISPTCTGGSNPPPGEPGDGSSDESNKTLCGLCYNVDDYFYDDYVHHHYSSFRRWRCSHPLFTPNFFGQPIPAVYRSLNECPFSSGAEYDKYQDPLFGPNPARFLYNVSKLEKSYSHVSQSNGRYDPNDHYNMNYYFLIYEVSKPADSNSGGTNNCPAHCTSSNSGNAGSSSGNSSRNGGALCRFCFKTPYYYSGRSSNYQSSTRLYCSSINPKDYGMRISDLEQTLHECPVYFKYDFREDIRLNYNYFPYWWRQKTHEAYEPNDGNVSLYAYHYLVYETFDPPEISTSPAEPSTCTCPEAEPEPEPENQICTAGPIYGSASIPPDYMGRQASAVPKNEGTTTTGWTVNLSGHASTANVNTYCKMIAN
jgi:hypothetical protein